MYINVSPVEDLLSFFVGQTKHRGQTVLLESEIEVLNLYTPCLVRAFNEANYDFISFKYCLITSSECVFLSP